MGVFISALMIFFCCLVIWRACDGFEVASEYIGRDLSEGVRGGTINAISSSMPELLTTLIGLVLLSDEIGFSIGLGTTAGSAIFNGMIIPAVCIFSVVGTVVAGKTVQSVLVSSKVLWRDGLSLIACEIVLIWLLNDTVLFWWHGAILMLLYVGYFSYMTLSMKKPSSDQNGETEREGIEDKIESDLENDDLGHGFFYWLSGGPLLDLENHFIGEKQRQQIEDEKWNGWPLLLASTAVIGIACFFLVKACEWLGTGSVENPSFVFFGSELSGIGVPTLFISVIFASMATSVPDTVISVRDARDGDYDDAVSNALGSNIFDVCFALGFPLFCYTLIRGPLEIAPEIAYQSRGLRCGLLLLTIAAFAIYIVGKRKFRGNIRLVSMGKVKATMLVALYFVFLTFVAGVSQGNQLALQIFSSLVFFSSSTP